MLVRTRNAETLFPNFTLLNLSFSRLDSHPPTDTDDQSHPSMALSAPLTFKIQETTRQCKCDRVMCESVNGGDVCVCVCVCVCYVCVHVSHSNSSNPNNPNNPNYPHNPNSPNSPYNPNIPDHPTNPCNLISPPAPITVVTLISLGAYR